MSKGKIQQPSIQAMAKIIAETIPSKDWTQAFVRSSVVTSTVDISSFYKTNQSEEWIEFDVFDLDYVNEDDEHNNITNFILALRESDYEANPAKGAFYTLVVEVNKGGDINVQMDHMGKPHFSMNIPDNMYNEDIRLFPRAKDNVPSWLISRNT